MKQMIPHSVNEFMALSLSGVALIGWAMIWWQA